MCAIRSITEDSRCATFNRNNRDDEVPRVFRPISITTRREGNKRRIRTN